MANTISASDSGSQLIVINDIQALRYLGDEVHISMKLIRYK